jgi:DNA-binding NtrC family response regulator
MKNEIGILIVEDNKADAEIMQHVLRKDGLSFEARCVETEAAFRHQLSPHPPDLILSDHGFASFDGFKALAIAKQECPEVPVIFVTGALGEEVAIASFKRGAADYILKNRLSHLAPAVRRALHEMEERAGRKRAEQERDLLLHELKEALTQIKTLTGLVPVCALCKKIRHHQHGWQPMEIFLQQHTDAALTHELCPECTQKIPPTFPRVGSSTRPSSPGAALA